MRFPTKNNLLFHSWIQIKEQSGEHSAISASVERPGVPGSGPQPVLWTLVTTVYILTPACLRPYLLSPRRKCRTDSSVAPSLSRAFVQK